MLTLASPNFLKPKSAPLAKSIQKLFIATQNPGKIAEFRHLLFPINNLLTAADFPDIALLEIGETGTSYRDNALLKAGAFFDRYQVPVLSDDSGLECEALNGSPGIHSARLGGNHLTWPERWILLNQQIDSSETPENRRAIFRTVLCYFDGQTHAYFEGQIRGLILREPKGEKGFGYDPIFWIPVLQKSMAEIDPATKNAVSHRAIAAAEFLRAHNS